MSNIQKGPAFNIRSMSKEQWAKAVAKEDLKRAKQETLVKFNREKSQTLITQRNTKLKKKYDIKKAKLQQSLQEETLKIKRKFILKRLAWLDRNFKKDTSEGARYWIDKPPSSFRL